MTMNKLYRTKIEPDESVQIDGQQEKINKSFVKKVQDKLTSLKEQVQQCESVLQQKLSDDYEKNPRFLKYLESQEKIAEL